MLVLSMESMQLHEEQRTLLKCRQNCVFLAHACPLYARASRQVRFINAYHTDAVQDAKAGKGLAEVGVVFICRAMCNRNSIMKKVLQMRELKAKQSVDNCSVCKEPMMPCADQGQVSQSEILETKQNLRILRTKKYHSHTCKPRHAMLATIL